jgi:diadenosine tetraphosphate (Ap4A) HIT family hydrolase
MCKCFLIFVGENLRFNYNMSANCIFCDLVTNISNGNKESQIEDTLLYENKHFVVIPAAGPLFSGHILIVSKKHYISVAQMPLEAIEDCISLMNHIQNQSHSILPNLIFSEHGACSENERGGSCVIHAHVQCIPILNNQALNNIDKFVQEVSISNFSEIQQLDRPYLYINTGDTSKFYISESVPSQLIRKIIYANNGRTDWDWRADKKLDMVKKTIELWSKIKL